MKQLTIIRHAKSSWEHPHLSDFERPLNSRGKRNAPMMGRILHDEGVMLDQIISSPAKRAITTARTIAGEMGYSENNIVKERSFYGAHSSTIIEILKDLMKYYNDAPMFLGGSSKKASKIEAIYKGRSQVLKLVKKEA